MRDTTDVSEVSARLTQTGRSHTVIGLEMKRLLTVLLVIVCLSSAAAATTNALLNAILVRVNDAVITLKDLQMRIFAEADFLTRQYGSQPDVLRKKLSELERNGLEELVQEQLVLHEFKTAGYKFPESYLEDRIAEEIREKGDRVKLTKTLQAQGLTFESYKEKVRERLIIQLMWKQNVPQDPLVSPHKIERYYIENRDQFKVGEEVKVRMITLPNQPPGSFISSKQLAREIVAKLEEGADFSAMARVYSQGSRGSEGGDWGWLDRSVLRPELAEQAFALVPGTRSGVIETADGCYLILVEDKRAARVKPLSEMRDEIEATLKAQENERLRTKWIDRLKAKSFLRYY